MSNQSIIRISKEICDIQRDTDLSIAVACRDSNVSVVTALIIGPPDTPYEFGFFEFEFRFPREYPRKEPKVKALTTACGRTRFNPNIYADGKVCLSILGTWRGDRGEQWSAAQGLESVLLSIQSLMSSNPYENEPGFESAENPQDKINQQEYVEKIRHETLRISVVARIERYLSESADRLTSSMPAPESAPDLTSEETLTPRVFVSYDPFKDLCKRRFLWYYGAYMDAVAKGLAKKPTRTRFVMMPFEPFGNDMDGVFDYAALQSRLKRVKTRLDEETLRWASLGKEKVRKGLTVAVNLQAQFNVTSAAFKANGAPHSIELEDGNPFVWIMTYFGKPMTNLDGGMFRFRISISPNFPQEQPRVRMETKIFHHRVARDGTVCYFVPTNKREDIKSHIEGIIHALEEENPSYDPRTIVNPEAHSLLWGTPEERKVYNRRLRRSVQQSMEDL